MMRPWFLLLLAAALPALAAPATYTLVYKDVPGTRHVYIDEYKMTGSMAPAMALPAGATPIMYTYEGSGREITEERIVNRTSDAASVKLLVTEGWSSMKTSSRLGANTKRSYSKPATITFDRSLTGAMANLQTSVSTVGAAGAGPTGDSLTFEYGPLMQPLRLPEGPVAIGESWETMDVVSLFPNTSADTYAVSKLVDVRVEGGRTCLVVVTKFTTGASVLRETGPQGETAMTFGPITGTVQALWDPALGELVRQTTDCAIGIQFDFSIKVLEQAINISARGTMNVKDTLTREERPLSPIPSDGLLLAICPESAMVATDKCPKVVMKRFKAHVPSLPCPLGHGKAAAPVKPPVAPPVRPPVAPPVTPPVTPPVAAKTLVDARKGFVTKLTRREQANEPVAEPPAAIFQVVSYEAPLGKNAAYLTPDPKDGQKHPAIIWIVGGDCNTIGEMWKDAPAENDQTAAAYRKAGLIMMVPSLRGGNKNPGVREGFLGEVDDVLAAADFLAKQPYVDPTRIYLGGHSTGGTLVLLTAECSDRFRAVFAFGPVRSPIGYGEDYCPFDMSPLGLEARLRAPAFWLPSIKSPTFAIEGQDGNSFDLVAMRTINKNPQVRFMLLKGADHFNILAPANAVIADRILKDTGPTCNLAFTADELLKPPPADLPPAPPVDLPPLPPLDLPPIGLPD